MLTLYVSRLYHLPRLWRLLVVLIIGVQVQVPPPGVVVDSGDGVMHYCAIPNFTR
jgi:hypothetical protein